jgi:hypothetical protein
MRAVVRDVDARNAGDGRRGGSDMTTTTAPEVTDGDLREAAARIHAEERKPPTDRWYHLPEADGDIDDVAAGIVAAHLGGRRP